LRLSVPVDGYLTIPHAEAAARPSVKPVVVVVVIVMVVVLNKTIMSSPTIETAASDANISTHPFDRQAPRVFFAGIRQK
jgi:hypothetical protein